MTGGHHAAAAKASKEPLAAAGTLRRPVVTGIVPAGPLYRTEEHHRQYLEKRGMAAACHVPAGR